MLASRVRFVPDALLLLRSDNGVPTTINNVGQPIQVDQTGGYWNVSGASIAKFGVDVVISSITGTVTFAIAIGTDSTFASLTAPSTVIVSESGPVSVPGHAVLGLSRDTVDQALRTLGAVTDVSGGGVSAATPVYITAVALVPAGNSVSWSAYECQLGG